MNEITPADVEAFRSHLLLHHKISLKTANNVVNGSLRAFFRDARRIDRLIEYNPCEPLMWPGFHTMRPDPLTREERDKYLKWAKKRLPFKHYVFVLTQFYTGMRLSEATALSWAM